MPPDGQRRTVFDANLIAFTANGGLSYPFTFDGQTLRVPNPRSPTSEWLTVSIGVATIVPTQLDHIEDFFVAADRMMYAAKAAGRNRVGAVRAGVSHELIANAALN